MRGRWRGTRQREGGVVSKKRRVQEVTPERAVRHQLAAPIGCKEANEGNKSRAVWQATQRAT